MQVSYDLAARATYVQLHDGDVARTVEISDSVMVDVDEHAHPLGVEFLTTPDRITPEMLAAVTDQFPALKVLREPEVWIEPGVPRLLGVF